MPRSKREYGGDKAKPDTEAETEQAPKAKAEANAPEGNESAMAGRVNSEATKASEDSEA